MQRARIAVDIGGTFTDLVLLSHGRVSASVKLLTTPGDPSEAVEEGIAELLEGVSPGDVGEVVHGTTLVANALIERSGPPTALITTKGFRDVLSIRREQRYDLYDLFLDMPEPLVPRRLRFEVDERVLADGSVDRALDSGEVRRAARRLLREGVAAVAVCLLHAYRTDDHERLVEDVLRAAAPGVAVSLSSDVGPEVGEFVRMSTTVANAYVLPLVGRYLEMLEKRLEGLGLSGPLRIMLSTGGGGLAGAATARRYPIRLLESGPAAGALSAAYWGGAAGHSDVLAFDMGGTTAKACVIEHGRPTVAKEVEAARVYRFTKGSGLPIRVPVIDLIEIGAGGGSIASIGPFGLPKVGPESTGADPGPACYGRGGVEATVTDADLLLGYLNPTFFLGGHMRLNAAAARRAVGRLGRDLDLSVPEAAAAVYRVVNENMAAAARMHAIERGRDLRPFALVATGGAGPVHAWGVAQALGIRTLVFPPGAGVASAFGMLTASPGLEFARSLPSALRETRWSEARRAISQMVRDGVGHLAQGGVAKDDVRVSVAADIRHRGQGESVTVELGTGLGRGPVGQVDEAFHQAYVALYGRRPPGVEAEVMTWRVRVIGPEPRIDVRIRGGIRGEAGKGSRLVWFRETGFTQADVLDRYRLNPGSTVKGPAVVEERESTVVIGPGGRGRVQPTGALVVEVR
jgi:N-methylhydantoinase A/oxoprolinase/acetone carboxylase beta subunit